MVPAVDILTELKSVKEQIKVMTEEINELRKANREQTNQLETLNACMNTTRHGLEEAPPGNKDLRVAFSAFLLETANGPTSIGPFDSLTVLAYKHVFLNIGEAYDPHTGVFTAPLKGVYVFRVFSKAFGSSTQSLTLGLFLNGKHVFSTHAHQAAGFYSSSNGASLPLEKGDAVDVRLYSGSWIFDNGEHHHSSFSGHLLFPL